MACYPGQPLPGPEDQGDPLSGEKESPGVILERERTIETRVWCLSLWVIASFGFARHSVRVRVCVCGYGDDDDKKFAEA